MIQKLSGRTPRPRPRRGSGRAATGAAAALVLTSLAAVTGSSTAQGAPADDPPSLRLFSSVPEDTVLKLVRGKGDPAYTELPFFVSPVGGTFDLRVRRSSYDQPITGTLVDGAARVPLGELPVSERWSGLQKFFVMRVTDGDGKLVRRKELTFCPNNYGQQRVDPDSVEESTFPMSCSGVPFTLGSVWGVDEGWATGVLRNGYLQIKLPQGRYSLTMTIAKRYRTLLHIPDAASSATVGIKARTAKHGDCRMLGCRTADRRTAAAGHAAAAGRTDRLSTRAAALRVPIDTHPDASTIPDLRTLPAFGISMQHPHGKDMVMFAANEWVAGDAQLDIEGFRRGNEELMDAYQYFFDGERPVGRAPVGTMEYDRRRGHHHWHLLQFARYQLLDADGGNVDRSKKQSWCLVPTDPADLSLPNAERQPSETGLDSACGALSALWIRETLPIGWGDTYYQYRGGQAFDVTDLPNGRYQISIEVNPFGTLYESDRNNNTALREIRIKGRPGHRRVCVPGVHGIDARGAC